MSPQSRKRRIVLTGLVVLAAPVLIFTIVGLVLFSRYVETVDADTATAEREFTAARARLPERAPLIQYRGFNEPTVRRTPNAPVQTLRTVHVLAYDADAAELTRGRFPVSVVRAMTLGGRIRLMGPTIGGEPDEVVTLGDLERHGPGLVLDSGKGTPGALALADAVLGTKSTQSRLLVWTD